MIFDILTTDNQPAISVSENGLQITTLSENAAIKGNKPFNTKTYFEIVVNASPTLDLQIGCILDSLDIPSRMGFDGGFFPSYTRGYTTNKIAAAWLKNSPDRIYKGDSFISLPGVNADIGDVIMIAINPELGLFWFGVNGVWSSGEPSTNNSPNISGLIRGYSWNVFVNTHESGCVVEGIFENTTYPPPSGYSLPLANNSFTAIVNGNITKLGNPFKAKVMAISVEDNPRVLSVTNSNPSTGDYEIDIYPYTKEVLLLATPEYGLSFEPLLEVFKDQIIHPEIPNKIVYKAINDGVLGSEEPVWVDSGTITSGSVTLLATPLFAPLANGFVKPVITPIT